MERKGLKHYLQGSFLAQEQVLRHWPFILYLSVLALISIYSSHRADQKVHRVSSLREEVKEMHSAYVDTRSRLMTASMESKVKARAGELGLEMSPEPPILITVKE